MIDFAREPMKFLKLLWPQVQMYDKQIEIIHSVRDNDETFVPAGNMLGKDFVGGFICLWYFLCHPVVRIITTSIRDDHTRVLWGEIGRFIQTSRVKLRVEDGGSLIINHRDIKKVNWTLDPRTGKGKPVLDEISYLRGMVSEKGEGMAGHHAPHTLLLLDEASGIDDVVYTQGGTWAKRILAIGNCNPTENFFRKNVEAGDLLAT